MPSAVRRSAAKRAPITEAAVTRLLSHNAQPIDARLDRCLHRGRHAHFGDIRLADVAAVPADQYTALGQLAHHLLGEKRVSGGPRRQ